MRLWDVFILILSKKFDFANLKTSTQNQYSDSKGRCWGCSSEVGHLPGRQAGDLDSVPSSTQQKQQVQEKKPRPLL